jgi:hypothetical protein
MKVGGVRDKDKSRSRVVGCVVDSLWGNSIMQETMHLEMVDR